MNKDFKSLDQKFMPLAVFDIGREVGRTVRGLAIRAYGRIRGRFGSRSGGSSNGGGANNGGAASPDVFN